MKLLHEHLPAAQKKKIPEIVFDNNKGQYWVRYSEHEFFARSGPQITEELQYVGINTEYKGDTGLSLGNELLVRARKENQVHFAAPLAGYKCGFFETDAKIRVLVTRSTFPVVAAKSENCPFIESYLEALLGDHDEDRKQPTLRGMPKSHQQVFRFISWCKVAYESLLKGDFKPGQFLVLAGPGGDGKSFLQIVITKLLGGTVADPYPYMIGKTDFNEELSEACHLAMGDKPANPKIQFRKEFASQIKTFCVEPLLRIHGKGKKGFSLQTARRVSLCLNLEHEHMLLIPPLDTDLKPKVTMLRCFPAQHTLSEDREENIRRINAELPNFARLLLNFKIPKAWHDPRFGVCAWQHPELMDIVNDLSPEVQLLRIIDDLPPKFWDNPPITGKWSGTAERLKFELLQTDFRDTVGSLLQSASACGTYLGRLASKFPSRVSSTRSKGKTTWHIVEPTGENE